MEVLIVAVDKSGSAGVLLELNVYVNKDQVSGFTLDRVGALALGRESYMCWMGTLT